MWCAEGMRAVKLTDVQQLRFAQPGDRERVPPRAGSAGAVATTARRRRCSLHFAGEGKRKVQVGLRGRGADLEDQLPAGAGGEGEAVPAGVGDGREPDRRGLGRRQDGAGQRAGPISFKMDLYNPLYVDRPTVEPELFASLRPVTYRGGFNGRRATASAQPSRRPGDAAEADVAAGPGGGGPARRLRPAGATAPAARRPTARPRPKLAGGRSTPNDAERGSTRSDVGRELGRRLGTGSGRQRGDGGRAGRLLPVRDRPPGDARPAEDRACCRSSARTSRARGSRIYNPSVQAKHPLLGLRFKNTSGAHLNQGPITVFEGSVYAGDTRVLDVQPNEERLRQLRHRPRHRSRSARPAPGTQKITSVKAVKGIVTTVTKVTEEKKYRIVNRSPDRPHAADRAPEPHEPAVQAGGHGQAGRGHARGVPVPDRR